MIQSILRKIFGTKHERDVRRLTPIVEAVGALEPEMSRRSEGELKELTAQLKARVAEGASLEEVLPEAFAAVREASRRSIGLRHYDVQIMGGVVLHEGRISEMKTGEGKTLVATLPMYLNSLSGLGVHLVTVNDYLARRDADWMRPLFQMLGVSVGFIQHDMHPEIRQASYACDITYGTNNEFGFDYLRDNMVVHPSQKVQRGHNFAIVDEVDSILIDEARTPLIISGQAEESTQLYREIDKLSTQLRKGSDYEVEEKDHAVAMTEDGVARAESLLGVGNLYEPENMHLVHHITQALRARELYKLDVDYVVREGEIVIVDEFTGRLMPGRRWSDGLHQAVEAKERVPIKRESLTLATITFQNFFKLYDKLGGMTGTADTEAGEFLQIYGLDVVVLPTNQPMIRMDDADVVFKTEGEKFTAVIEEIMDCHERGQPVLVGTISIEKSEKLSGLLSKKGVPHHVLNAKHHEKEAEIVAQAGRLKGVTIATNMAGRGTDILLGGNPQYLARMRAAKDDPASFTAELERAKGECEREHEQVVSLGGLHILGTERHESRRIDNQLRGRAGRQGDPGSSRFYISLEDDLMRLFGGDRVSKMMDMMKWDEGEPIIHPWVTKAIARAQERVELMNFDRRKRLLDYDNVMNQHRELIYELRALVLEGSAEEVQDHVIGSAEELLDEVITADAPENMPWQEWNVKHLAEYLKRTFGVMMPEEALAGQGSTVEGLREMLTSEIKGRFEAKKTEIGGDIFVDICRQVIMMQIDTKWRDHLSTMDSLREGIGWRGAGGSDPLVEYKHEAFALFSGLMGALKEEVVSFIYHVRPPSDGGRPQPRAQKFSAADGRKPAAPGRTGEIKTRSIGRNDPCPCGSGKKYKKCCGA